MGTLMDKLNATNATKEQIRQAIERKKVSVPENTPLKDYPAKIDGIYPDALFLKTEVLLPEFPDTSEKPIGVAAYDKLFLAYTSSNIYFVSKNGSAWKQYRFADFYPIAIYSFRDMFIAIANNKDYTLRSKDGITWEKSSVFSGVVIEGGSVWGVDNGDGTFFLFIKSKKKMMQTTDGISWTPPASSISFVSNSFDSAVFDKKTKKFYYLRPTGVTWSDGGYSLSLYSSEDGKTGKLLLKNTTDGYDSVYSLVFQGDNQGHLMLAAYVKQSNGYSDNRTCVFDVSDGTKAVKVTENIGMLLRAYGSGYSASLKSGWVYVNQMHDISGDGKTTTSGEGLCKLSGDATQVSGVIFQQVFRINIADKIYSIDTNGFLGMQNGIFFYRYTDTTSQEYKVLYSAFPINSPQPTLNNYIQDASDELQTDNVIFAIISNGTIELLADGANITEFKNALQAAYEAGVNSI